MLNFFSFLLYYKLIKKYVKFVILIYLTKKSSKNILFTIKILIIYIKKKNLKRIFILKINEIITINKIN